MKIRHQRGAASIIRSGLGVMQTTAGDFLPTPEGYAQGLQRQVSEAWRCALYKGKLHHTCNCLASSTDYSFGSSLGERRAEGSMNENSDATLDSVLAMQ